jgi:hypothetical protein
MYCSDIRLIITVFFITKALSDCMRIPYMIPFYKMRLCYGYNGIPGKNVLNDPGNLFVKFVNINLLILL